MAQLQVWRHTKSGEDFIVILDSDGQVVEASGPLHHTETQEALDQGFDNDPEMVEELREHGDQYVLLKNFP